MQNPIDSVLDALDKVNPALLAIGGLFTFCALGIGFIIWRFGASRDVWSAFAEAHGLEVSGLDVGSAPRISGRYRGTDVEIGMQLLGTIALQRRGRYEISDTRVIAYLGAPLEEATWLDADEFEKPTHHPLLADAATGPVVTAFLRDTRQAAITETAVTATIEAMPDDVASLERLVDSCVRCAEAIDARVARGRAVA